MAGMEVDAPAKINLGLHVTGKRADGYHTLESLMCCIGWFDRIRLDFNRPGISVSCAHPDVPEDRTNIAYQAAETFSGAIKKNIGVHIAIEKHIPVGAGLGGGSSDAAAVLKALNARWGDPFTMAQLMRMGLSIGADVPFFIFGKPALATGIGEKLAPCRLLQPCHALVIYPGIYISTAAVYKTFDFSLTKHEKINTKQNSIQVADASGMYRRIRLYNDLENVAFSMHPRLREIKEAIGEAGAQGVLMSGSGSSVFGLFNSRQEALAASLRLEQWGNTGRHGDGWRQYIAELIS